MSLEDFVASVEHKWRDNLRRTYPLYRKTPVEWHFNKDQRLLWDSHFQDNALVVQVLAHKRKTNKKVKKVAKLLKIDSRQVIHDYFMFHLFAAFYRKIEAPFSTKGERCDRNLIHKAIWDGVGRADPDLSVIEQLQRVALLQLFIKDLISNNRLFLENEEHAWFNQDLLFAPYLELLEEAPKDVNILTVMAYLVGGLHGPLKFLRELEVRYSYALPEIAGEILNYFLESGIRYQYPMEENDYLRSDDKYSRNLRQAPKAIRKVFEGKGRYEGIERLSYALNPYIEEAWVKFSDLTDVALEQVVMDLFALFSPNERSGFVRGILDKTLIRKEQEPTDLLELQTLHEFYRKNHPVMVLRGEKEYEQNVLFSENHELRLSRHRIIGDNDIKDLDLAGIYNFQQTHGVPVLIPLPTGGYILNQYEFVFRRKRSASYNRLITDVEIPQVLELYIDKTGSMFFEEDQDNVGFNDGSRRDISISVTYAFIFALYEESLKQSRTCYVRFHSFAETQVSSPLITLQEFVNGDPRILRVIFRPDNGYEYENLNLSYFNDGMKRVYIVVTDGDLVIKGRTEREAKKMKYIARKPHNQLVLFEMESEYSLGRAVKGDEYIIAHRVYDKETMFYRGLEVILPRD